MASAGKKRRYPTASSPNESEDDNGEHSTSQSTNKRRGSVAADFAPHRLIVSERQQMAVLKQLTAGEESNTGSQSPSSSTVPQTRPSKLHRRNEHGETIVHIAARKGDLKQLRKVLKAGANVNEADNAGWTPLHEAVTKNQFHAARLLLKSGANANAPGPEGQTPLVDAVLNNNTKMAELLLNFSADPSVVDVNRLNETMSKVLKRELSVLDSSDNENNDEDSHSPLSPLTSENDFEHDEEKLSDEKHNQINESIEANLSPHSAQSQRKKPYHRFQDRSSHSSDSSSQSKTRTTSGNPESSSSTSSSITGANLPNKNPYDFESEEEGEIRETTNETTDDQQTKKKTGRKTEHSKSRTNSGGNLNSISETNFGPKKRFNRLDDEHIHRVPPLKIVLARAVVQRSNDIESYNSPSMMDETASLTIDSTEKPDEEDTTSPSDPTTSPPPLTIITTTTTTNDEDSTIIHGLIQQMIDEIESTVESNIITVLPIIEDEQMDMDDEGDDDDDDDERKKSDQTAQILEKSPKTDSKEQISKLTTRKDLKPTTRTLRSHARGKSSLSASVTNSSDGNNHGRRVSSRRRVLEAKSFMNSGERERKRRTISERLRREKDSNLNEEFQTSSNSDDQTTEYSNLEKIGQQSNSNAGNTHDDASSCSSTGAGEGSSTSSSTNITKPSSSSIADLDILPPNKRRLRDRNAAISNNNNNNTTIDVQGNVNCETSPNDSQTSTSTIHKELPVNGIRQFLEIRQQIDKRHENMLNEFVTPRVPKDFAETTMAKKNYLISSSCSPASMGIQRLNPPHDLDPHLMDVFTKQEDERYKMRLRHRVERDKLILSHEQEVLRLYGNATRSSLNQEIPFSYCSLLKDNEVYNNPSIVLPEKERLPPMINADGTTTTELGKRGKHRWNTRSFFKWLEDSNLKYKRLSCELNERQRLEAETLYSMQRMVWSKHLPKESPNLSSSGRTNYFLTNRYLPKVDINPDFWTQWETTSF